MKEQMDSTVPVFESHLRATQLDVDELGHVNNTSYIRWMQDAAVAHSSALGWGFERYKEIDAAWVARAHFIEYLIPAFENDQILIRTWVSGFRKVMSWRRYDIFRIADGEETLIARAETKWAFVGMQDFRPQRVPAGMRDCFTLIEEEKPLMPR